MLVDVCVLVAAVSVYVPKLTVMIVVVVVGTTSRNGVVTVELAYCVSVVQDVEVEVPISRIEEQYTWAAGAPMMAPTSAACASHAGIICADIVAEMPMAARVTMSQPPLVN